MHRPFRYCSANVYVSKPRPHLGGIAASSVWPRPLRSERHPSSRAHRPLVLPCQGRFPSSLSSSITHPRCSARSDAGRGIGADSLRLGRFRSLPRGSRAGATLYRGIGVVQTEQCSLTVALVGEVKHLLHRSTNPCTAAWVRGQRGTVRRRRWRSPPAKQFRQTPTLSTTDRTVLALLRDGRWG
jgi:hypothetical protein